MAALRSAVSPDFTYSQSYLSLLSAAGCMTGIICCTSPAIWAMGRGIIESRPVGYRAQRRGGDLQLYISGPTAKNSRNTSTQSAQEGGGRDIDVDVEKGPDTSTDTGEADELPMQEDIPASERKFASPADEANGVAVALFNFHPRHENELSLMEGQLIWVHHRGEPGWLVAQNWRSNDEIGLVPEMWVQICGKHHFEPAWAISVH